MFMAKSGMRFNIMKKFFSILVTISLFSGLAGAEIIKVGKLGDANSSVVTTDKESGKILWESKVQMRKLAHEGKNLIYIKEVGEGITGREKKWMSWVSESYSQLVDGQLIPYRVKIVYKDKAGKVIKSIEKYYLADKKQVVVMVDGKAQSFKFYPDLLDRAMMGVVLGFYPFERKEIKFHLLTHEPALYSVTVKNLGKKMIKYKGRDLEVYQLQMSPDLGLLNIVGAFVPKTYFYYTAKAPHILIDYEGLDGGLGAAYVKMQMTLEPIK
jgi:hypothetical protein